MANDRSSTGEGQAESPLARWARRKQAAQRAVDATADTAVNNKAVDEKVAGEKVADEKVADEKVADEGTAAIAGEADAQAAQMAANRQAAEAINIDALDYQSDYTPFMKAGVPEALTKRALQQLWRSNPVLANLDGLNDYDENFASPSLIMKHFDSAWQAGRGYLKKQIEAAEPSEPASAEDAQPTPAPAEEPVSAEPVLPMPMAETDEVDEVDETAKAGEVGEHPTGNKLTADPPQPAALSLRSRLGLTA